MSIRPHRRRFLQLALAAGALPLLPSRLVRASGGAPRNLVLVYHPNGLEPGWAPEDDGPLVLSDALAPFAGLEEKMVVLDGIKGGIRSEPLAHPEGMTSLWTGAEGNGDDTEPAGASVDQRVAERIGRSSAFGSLQLGAQSVEGPIDRTNVTSYDAAGRALAPDDDPGRAFARIFGAAGADADEALARRRAVLAYARGSVGRVRDLYGMREAVAFDAHLDAIGSLETRLDRLGALASCGGDALRAPSALYDPSVFGDIIDLQSELAVRALTCGATRVVSLQLAHSTTAVRIPGVNPSVALHQVMHERTPAEKRAINAFFIERVASLVRRLDETPGDAGGTLLDETLVVWATEMSIGNHGNHPLPFFLFGAAETLAGGRCLRFAPEARPRHTRVLETVAPLLGLEAFDRFGDWRDAESVGVLEELLR